MEIIIHLAKDTVRYDTEKEYGTLKHGLFGVEDFSIHRRSGGGYHVEYYVDFLIDNGHREIVWSFPCKFTDHGLNLVVDIKDI